MGMSGNVGYEASISIRLTCRGHLDIDKMNRDIKALMERERLDSSILRVSIEYHMAVDLVIAAIVILDITFTAADVTLRLVEFVRDKLIPHLNEKYGRGALGPVPR